MLEPRRLLSTSPVYDFDAAANTGTPAQGVTVSWAQGLKPAAPQTRVMLANLPAHAMVYADVDFKATAVGTHSVDTAGRTSQQTVDANGTVARSGIDGWVADANGTLTITVGGDAQSLAGLHVYAYDPTVSLTADGTLYRDGDPVTLTGTRDLPGTFADITKSEPVPDLTVQLADNGGTAQPGTDYTLSPPSLNFTAARVSDTTLVNPAGGSGATTAETIDLVAQIDDRLLATSGITVLASKPTGLGHAGSEPGVSKSNPLKLDANPGRGVYRHVKITDSSGERDGRRDQRLQLQASATEREKR